MQESMKLYLPGLAVLALEIGVGFQSPRSVPRGRSDTASSGFGGGICQEVWDRRFVTESGQEGVAQTRAVCGSAAICADLANPLLEGQPVAERNVYCLRPAEDAGLRYTADDSGSFCTFVTAFTGSKISVNVG